jgi:hypothetical protein
MVTDSPRKTPSPGGRACSIPGSMSATNVGWPRLVDMPDAELLVCFEAALAAHPDAPADPKTVATLHVTDQHIAAAQVRLEAEAPAFELPLPAVTAEVALAALAEFAANNPSPAVRQFVSMTMKLPPYEHAQHRPVDWAEIARQQADADARELLLRRSAALVLAHVALAGLARASRSRRARHVQRKIGARASASSGDDDGSGGDGPGNVVAPAPLLAVAA